jgi:two-component system response regulator LytT
MVKIAIVDDSIEILASIRKIVENITIKFLDDQELEIYTYARAELLIYDLEEHVHFDIFLLDVEMPDMNGIELAKNIRKMQENGYIIFLTSHPQFAIRGYDRKVRAYQYLLKETMNSRLPEVMEDVIRRCLREEKQYYFIVNQHRMEKLKYQNIIHIKKDGKNCMIVMVDGVHTDRTTLENIMSCLDTAMFLPIERGCIVNIEHICKIQRNEVYMDNGDILEISRNNIQKVKKRVSRYWGENV